MPPNKIWGIIKSDRPSVRSFVRLSVRSKKISFFKKVCHLNFTFIWEHLSRTVTQFLFISKMFITSINRMCGHLLESSHRDDSNKGSHIRFDEEIK